jgi:hypothetical protein
MKRTNLGILWVAAFATTLVFACGSDEKPSTGSTTDDDSSDSSSETPSSGSSAPNNPKPPADGIGAPVLTDVDPDTELSDLDDDQLKEVCTAYVKTSDAVSDSLGQLCPAQSLFFAIQTESVIDDESYQAECAAQLDACEEQVEEANEETPEQRCAGAGACGATLEDFNACNAQIAAMNRLVLVPLTKEKIQECSDTSHQDAANKAAALGVMFFVNLANVTAQTGGNPTQADGPCQRIAETCPEFGLALGAFGELGAFL